MQWRKFYVKFVRITLVGVGGLKHAILPNSASVWPWGWGRGGVKRITQDRTKDR